MDYFVESGWLDFLFYLVKHMFVSGFTVGTIERNHSSWVSEQARAQHGAHLHRLDLSQYASIAAKIVGVYECSA